MNVLIIRFSAIGDVAMSIPVVYSVARANPEHQFVLLTRKSMASMVVNHPENLTVEGIDVHAPEYQGPMGLRRVWKQMKTRYRIDAIADLHGVLRTWQIDAWARLDGTRISRIRKGRRGRRVLTRPNNKVMLPLPSQRDRYREVFHRLGLTVHKDFTSLFGAGGGDASLFSAITGPKAAGERWVGIAPFARHKGKIYPPKLMEEVVRVLSSDGVKVFLFGGAGTEAEILEGWKISYPSVVSLAGKKLGFGTELALMSHLDVMVSMDSANMHLASVAGVPVVSVWGATHPYAGFKGYRQNEEDSVQLSMTCRPCSIFGDKPCPRGDYHCLNGISPAAILQRVMKHLG